MQALAMYCSKQKKNDIEERFYLDKKKFSTPRNICFTAYKKFKRKKTKRKQEINTIYSSHEWK